MAIAAIGSCCAVTCGEGASEMDRRVASRQQADPYERCPVLAVARVLRDQQTVHAS